MALGTDKVRFEGWGNIMGKVHDMRAKELG